MFGLPAKFISISREFLTAFRNPYTYDLRYNYYMFYGFLWGMPVIAFSLAIDFSLEHHALTMAGLVDAFRNHAFHWFALAQPLIVMIIFGAMGTVQNEKDKGLKYLIEVLEDAVREKSEELLRSYSEAVAALADAIEAKDPYTRGHCHRVRMIALAIAREVGGYTAAELRDLEFAAILHDIGKISVPLEIIRKPASLAPDEFAIIKRHSAEGVRILQNISNFEQVRTLILRHHERPDGKGYPDGIRNHDVLSGILALADVFDAMTIDRPYQKGLPHREALVKIKALSGQQFLSPLVEILEKLVAAGALEPGKSAVPPPLAPDMATDV